MQPGISKENRRRPFGISQFASPKDIPDIVKTILSFTACSQTLIGDYGTFASPNYPNRYPNNADCVYRIFAGDGKKINLTLNVLDIENSGDCRKDSLRISEMVQGSFQHVATICGKRHRMQIRPLSNMVTVTFKSDVDGIRNGFHASYHIIKESKRTMSC